MEELATKYDPRAVEDKWYAYWMQHRLFHSEPDAREPYTIVIPPAECDRYTPHGSHA